MRQFHTVVTRLLFLDVAAPEGKSIQSTLSSDGNAAIEHAVLAALQQRIMQ